MIRNKVMENSFGQMIKNIEYLLIIRVNGLMANSMEQDITKFQMVMKDKVSGRMEKELNGWTIINEIKII